MKKKIIINICRFIFAAVFIFSGFVKAIDPLGFSYKIEDYLINFGSFFSAISFLALPVAITLSAIEFFIGFCFLFGIYTKRTSILALIFMAVMTPLTLYIALFNPVTDCGCFGDALIISNWTTFYKNIVLSAFVIFIFINHKQVKPVFGRETQWILSIYGFIFMVALSLYCYAHLPIIDFRPYKIGTRIADGMIIPEGAPKSEYETSFIYEKNGVKKEFTLQNYPANDKSWKFVDQKSKIIKKGYEPPIHDFSIELPADGDITQEVLADTSYTFLLVSHKLEAASTNKSKQINDIYKFAKDNNYKFYCLSSSLNNNIQDYIEETDAKYPMATTDDITLKTMIRSNPGLILLKNGTVINMWHNNDLPNFDKPLAQSDLGKIQKPNNTKNVLSVACIFLIPVLLIGGWNTLTKRKKK